jgi:hypothetical protein
MTSYSPFTTVLTCLPASLKYNINNTIILKFLASFFLQIFQSWLSAVQGVYCTIFMFILSGKL